GPSIGSRLAVTGVGCSGHLRSTPIPLRGSMHLRLGLRSLVWLPIFAASFAAIHCGGSTNNPNLTPDAGDQPDGAVPDTGTDPDGATGDKNPDAVGAKVASKVDVLLVVDNSASMTDKAKLLSGSVGALLRKVATVGDVHVGVITSSLGTMGGNVCADT